MTQELTPGETLQMGNVVWPDSWGEYEPERVWDNEDFDREPRVDSVVILSAEAGSADRVICQNVDMTDEEFEEMAKCPVVQSAEFFGTPRNFGTLSDAGVARVIRSGVLSHLRYFDMNGCYELGDETLKAIAEGGMPNLEGLMAGGRRVTDEGLIAIAASTHLEKLKIFMGQQFAFITYAGVAALSRKSGLGALYVGKGRPDMVEPLTPEEPQLEAVHHWRTGEMWQMGNVPWIDEWGGYEEGRILDNEDFDREPRVDFEFLLTAPAGSADRVTYQYQDLDDQQFAQLAASAVVQSAEYFDVQRNRMGPTDEGIAAVLRTGILKHLRYFSVDSCYELGDETMKAIAEGAMPNLEALAFGSTSVTDEGLRALAESKHLEKLQGVMARFCENVTGDGIQVLADKESVKGLEM